MACDASATPSNVDDDDPQNKKVQTFTLHDSFALNTPLVQKHQLLRNSVEMPPYWLACLPVAVPLGVYVLFLGLAANPTLQRK